jgi:hypothetical protein
MEFVHPSDIWLNEISFTQIEYLNRLCNEVLQPVRKKFNNVITINSGIRSRERNKIVGGVSNSQHIFGEACDFTCLNMGDAFEYISKYLTFDQLIWEFGNDESPQFIHVSLKLYGNRKMILKSFIDENGKVSYSEK